MLKHNPVLSFSLLLAALACSRLPLEIGEGIDGVFPPGNGSSPDEYCVAELELCLESGRDGAYCERERDRCEITQYPSTGGAAGVGGSPSGCTYVAAAGSAAYICPGAGGTTAGGAAGTTGGASGDCGGRAGAGGGGATGGYCGGSAGAGAGGTSTGGAGAGGTGVGGASAGGTSTGGTGTGGAGAGGTGVGGAGAGGTGTAGTSAGGTGAGGGAPLDCISPYDACLDSGEEPALCHELFTTCEASAS